MEENKPVKDLKDILAKVEAESPVLASSAPPPTEIKEERSAFVERAKVEKIFNQLQESPSETVAPQEILPLLIESDDGAEQTPNSKILTDLIKQKN